MDHPSSVVTNNLPSLFQILQICPILLKTNQSSYIFQQKISLKKVILAEAQAINADLIIVGSHGRHGVSLILGSTANAILHGAQCDVLAVRVPD